MTDDQVLCVPEIVGCDIFFIDKRQNKKYRGTVIGTSSTEEGLNATVSLRRLTLSGTPLPQVINMELSIPYQVFLVGNQVRVFTPPGRVIKITGSTPQQAAA